MALHEIIGEVQGDFTKFFDNDSIESRESLTELFRNEMPVLCTRTKLYQGELAERISISRQTYSSIEIGWREML